MLSFVLIILFAVMLLTAFLLFDRLVHVEYQFYRSNWVADGKPHGFFWVPAEVKTLGGWMIKGHSSIASKRCAIIWLFSTPDWLRGDPRAKRFLYWLRFLVALWNLSILLTIFLVCWQT